MKTIDVNCWIKATLEDGTEYIASTPQEIVHAMKLDSWSRPKSVNDYKQTVQKFTYAAKGTTFVFWDATSFLLGLEKCGVLKLSMEVIVDAELE